MNTKELALLCQKSYKEETFKVGELEVLLEKDGATCIVAIRGTEASKFFSGGGWRDVVRDLFAIPYTSPLFPNKGHRGMLRGAEDVLQELEKRVDKHTPLVITGHSLGAGVGLAVAVGGITKGLNVVKFVGFGCPKVFYSEKKNLPEDTASFVTFRNGNDIVPRVPTFMGKRMAREIDIGIPSSRIWTWRDHPLEDYIESIK